MRATPAHGEMVAQPAFSSGSNGPTGFSPSQIRDAYGLSSVSFNGIVGDGSGQTIAIVVAYDNPSFVSSTDPNYANSDLAKFNQQYGLPDPPSFIKVGQTGSQTGLPGIDPSGNWENETALDVEWAHAAAPAANIVLIECNSDSLDDLIFGGVQAARLMPAVSVVSMSFAAPEAASELKYDPYFLTPANHQNMTFLAASGDNGAGAQYPAASPTVIGVGGTTASLAGNVYSSETALSNGGGGVSLYEPKPAYQSGLTQSATHRIVPDVSFAANHFTNGFSVYDSYNGGANPWYSVGGTSAAAPVWAGMIAMANQGRVRLGLRTLNAGGSTMPRLYYLPQTDFHDVTTGSNGNAATTGYDLVTGRGTPIANILVPDLAGAATITGSAYVDANVNSTRDAGELGQAGATVFIDLDGNGTPSGIDPVTTTNADGTFTFSDLPGGTYNVTVLPYVSYAPTTATTYTVTVGYNASVTTAAYGQRKVTGTISGHVFEDLALTRYRVNSDPMFAGWSVFLDTNNDGMYEPGEPWTLSDSTGLYQFSGLSLGAVYHVYQVIPPGFSRTTFGGTGAYDLTLLKTSAVLDFGYVPNSASISGNVFRDDNGTGVREGVEPPIYGTALYLDLDRNGIYTPGVDVYVLTDPSGNYTISGLAPGTYVINQVIPLGYHRTNNVTTGFTVVVGVAAAVANVNFADQLN